VTRREHYFVTVPVASLVPPAPFPDWDTEGDSGRSVSFVLILTHATEKP
jgi:hypothetical protein